MKIDTEAYSFQLILHSGNARSLAFEALQAAKQSNFNEANTKYEEAKKELVEAQKMHAQLLRMMANQEEIDINILLIHAEDHITASSMAVENTREFIDLYQIVRGDENG